MENQVESCIECGKCTAICTFLHKYGINLKEYAEMPELAFHCFLCGECKRHCPINIDGRQISLNLRQTCILNGYEPNKEGYSLLLLEKKNYLFKNYRHGHTKTVFFPGCNFTAYFPNTTFILSQTFSEKGIGTVYDCCKKPVSELQIQNHGTPLFDGLLKRLIKNGIEELIVLCPNCYYYLKDQHKVKITSIYDVIEPMQMAEPIDLSQGMIYLPCPDRDLKIFYQSMRPLFTGAVEDIRGIQCCGAGGCAAIKEPELANDLSGAFKAFEDKKIYTYCATCSGIITQKNIPTEHILCKLINSSEKPAQGIQSLKNRMLFKFK